jgi:predicted nucleotidyltransferase
MKRETALALLQRHRTELMSLGVVSLSIVGSTAREEATASSDAWIA